MAERQAGRRGGDLLRRPALRLETLADGGPTAVVLAGIRRESLAFLWFGDLS